MNEAGRKGQLVKLIHVHSPGLVVLRHEDHFTAGIPDMSISRTIPSGTCTLWLEVKYGHNWKTDRIQFETLRRLNGFYVVYGRDKITSILRPERNELGDSYARVADGKLHEPVIEFIKQWRRHDFV